MRKTVLTEGDDGVSLIVRHKNEQAAPGRRRPVHVVYGGADRFSTGTPRKLGRIALQTMDEYAGNFAEFARALDMAGSGELPGDKRSVSRMEACFAGSPTWQPEDPAWLAWAVFERTREKLRREPVEDIRIDFEDGYGAHPDSEEDAHATAAGKEMAAALVEGTLPEFSGIRVRPFGADTHRRSSRTLDIFFDSLLSSSSGRLPANFVVTLPKVLDAKEVRRLCKQLARIEKRAGIAEGHIGVELMIETPGSIIDGKGRLAVPGLVDAAAGRCRSLHFGAYDYTAALGIASSHQGLRHPACDLARQLLLLASATLGVPVADSVTVELPVPVHRGAKLSRRESEENAAAVHRGWRIHFSNITLSMVEGFYQSWDLHPNQLPARFAAVNYFYLNGIQQQAARLRSFMDAAERASLTGTTFDDAASVLGIMTLFRQAVDCGALTADEAVAITGLSQSEVRAGVWYPRASGRARPEPQPDPKAVRTPRGGQKGQSQ
jgi:citrate lyase beta subunit